MKKVRSNGQPILYGFLILALMLMAKFGFALTRAPIGHAALASTRCTPPRLLKGRKDDRSHRASSGQAQGNCIPRDPKPVAEHTVTKPNPKNHRMIIRQPKKKADQAKTGAPANNADNNSSSAKTTFYPTNAKHEFIHNGAKEYYGIQPGKDGITSKTTTETIPGFVCQNGKCAPGEKTVTKTEYVAHVIVSGCKGMDCDETEAVAIPFGSQMQDIANLDSIIQKRLRNKMDCLADANGNKLDNSDQMSCLADQINHQPRKDRLKALKKVLQKYVEPKLASDKSSKRSKAMDNLSALADSLSGNLSTYVKNFKAYAKDVTKIIDDGQRLTEKLKLVPSMAPQSRAMALINYERQYHGLIDNIVNKWRQKVAVAEARCSTVQTLGFSCSSDVDQVQKRSQKIFELAQKTEANAQNIVQTSLNNGSNSGINQLGLRSGDRSGRVNITSLVGSNMGRGNVGNFGQNQFGNTFQNSMNRGPTFNGSQTFNPNFRQNLAVNSVNAQLRSNSLNRFNNAPIAQIDSNPISFSGSQLGSGRRTSPFFKTQNRSLNSQLDLSLKSPFPCRGIGPGYCQHGV